MKTQLTDTSIFNREKMLDSFYTDLSEPKINTDYHNLNSPSCSQITGRNFSN
jgi:hypothetical protein